MSPKAIRTEAAKSPVVMQLGEPGGNLLSEVSKRSGTDVSLCFHCRTCASGCPFLQAMDYPPNAVLRLLQYGLVQEVLECKAIWVCVGCHTCSSQCPMSIDMAAVMNTLRLMALERGFPLGKLNIVKFHQEVMRSLKSYGRAHKLGIMWRYKINNHEWFKDVDVGLKMLVNRKLEF